MRILAIAFSVGCVVSLVLTPLIRSVCVSTRLVDRPDGHRKLHDRSIALGGGLAAFTSTLIVLLGLAAFSTVCRLAFAQSAADLAGLAAAAVALLAVGVADDAIGIRGRQKLLGQIACCLIVVASGVVIETVEVFGWTIDLGFMSVPLTVLWLLAAINAINLLDGINGLAASIGIINCAALALMAHYGRHAGHALIAATFAGSLLGFLRYNFPKASVFLGDAGSMLIGLLVGVISIQSSLKGPGTVLIAAPVCLWAIPFFDSFAAIVRRKLTGRSIFSTDRAHLHHRLTDRVGGVWATGIVAVGCLITSLGALASVTLKNETVALVSGTTLIVIFVMSRMFGHSELRLMASRLQGLGRSLLVIHPRQKLRPVHSAVRLQGRREWDQLWSVLTDSAEQMPLEQIELDVNAPSLQEGFHATWRRRSAHGDERLWRLEMPLLVMGHRVGHVRMSGQRTLDSAVREMELLLAWLESFEGQLTAVVSESDGRSAA